MRISLSLFASAALLRFASATPAVSFRQFVNETVPTDPTKNATVSASAVSAFQFKLDQSCDRANPFEVNEAYSDKVNAAIEDVATFAKNIVSGELEKASDGEIAYKDSDAFHNYFTDGEYDQVMKMIQAVSNTKLLSDNSTSPTYDIYCGSDQNLDLCSGANIAGTASTADKPKIVLCDKFFDPNESLVTNELSARDDGTDDEGWCHSDEKFPFFSVSALILFDQMTRLDAIGAAADLPSRTIGDTTSHGSVDILTLGSEDDWNYYKRDGTYMPPYETARQLKYLWDCYNEDNATYKPMASTVENAHSYAASALQWHFQLLCKFSIEKDWSPPNQEA